MGDQKKQLFTLLAVAFGFIAFGVILKVASINISKSPLEDDPGGVGLINSQKQNMDHLVTIKTNLGEIQFATYDADAPKTVENFITLANKGFYNKVIFHRVIGPAKAPPGGFMIQGGDPTGTGRGGPGYTFDDELNPETQSYQEGYTRGTVAMANAGPNTNGSQFFIMLADTPQLPRDYTIFGKVVKGMEVVDQIGAVPTDEADRPLQAVTMDSVTVADNTQQ
jgi:cyclophilin family peptidyl-prolyl cis-trans isomerase